MASHSRPERPRMPERRRISATIYRDRSQPYYRDRSSSAMNDSSESSQRRGYVVGQQQPERSSDREYLDYFDLRSSTPGTLSPDSAVDRDDDQTGALGPPPSLISSGSISCGPTLPQLTESDMSHRPLPSPGFATSQSWNILTPGTSDTNSRSGNTPMSDGQSETYGSLDSVTLYTPDTMASSLTGSYVAPGSSPPWASPAIQDETIGDLVLPDSFFQSVSDDIFAQNDFHRPNEFSFEKDRLPDPPDWNFHGGYTVENDILSSNGPTFQQGLQDDLSFLGSQVPWTSHNAQDGRFGMDASTGNGAFEPDRGPPFTIFQMRERILNPSLPALPVFGPERAVSEDNDHEQWQQFLPPDADPCTNVGESSQDILEQHSHVFSAITGREIPRSQQGHTRKRTPQERQQTLKVRNCRACWPCHLLKTKCSPCSSGSPCEQCTRLFGKRRFCQLPCFNDPIESLHTFLLPDFLVGHLTKANVELFISQNATHWGSYSIPVRMSWGSRRLLAANVVALSMRDSSSELGYNNQVIANKSGRPALVRRKSPPLGISLAAMVDMEDEYRRHVKDVVRNDLAHYVAIAYDDQASKLPERLLEAVCTWYQMGVETNDQCTLLQEAIEIHITCSILERSLVLDKASIDDVNAHLQEDFLPRSVPRCAQRQIKLAFFMAQRPRIVRVLEQWGKLMRSTGGSDKMWATAFCVFIVLTLVMDKTIIAAHYMCEQKIELHRYEAKTRRQQFKELVTLMETEFFERCKEIFHCRYKTRKGWNERCNPIQDGTAAWRGEQVDGKTILLIDKVQGLAQDCSDMQSPPRHAGGPFLSPAERGQHLAPPSPRPNEVEYADLGRLARIFLRDFSNHT